MEKIFRSCARFQRSYLSRPIPSPTANSLSVSFNLSRNGRNWHVDGRAPRAHFGDNKNRGCSEPA